MVERSSEPLTTLGSDVPASRPGTIVRMSREVSYSSYSGPVPPPELLLAYDELDPGRGGKILQLAEDQTRHRMRLEDRVITSDIVRSWAGLVLGFVFGLLILAAGSALIYGGHDWAGAGIITGTLVTGAGVFVYGRSSQAAERERKSQVATRKK